MRDARTRRLDQHTAESASLTAAGPRLGPQTQRTRETVSYLALAWGPECRAVGRHHQGQTDR